MDATIVSNVTLTFIRGGISKKGSPYLQVSNGRAEFFVRVPKNYDNETFENQVNKLEENDLVTLKISLLVGSESVTLVDIIE